MESIPASSNRHPTNVASVERDEDGIWLMNVGTPRLGKFDDVDQDNLKASLQATLKAAMRDRVVDSAGMIDVHLSIRKYFVATTNTAVAVFAGVDWCAADANNRILFQETFYATRTVSYALSVGDVKDAVDRTMVKRIAQSAIALAAEAQPGQVEVAGTYSTFEEAAARMPYALVAAPVMADTQPVPGLPIPAYVEIPAAGPESVHSEFLRIRDPIDWEKRLPHGK